MPAAFASGQDRLRLVVFFLLDFFLAVVFEALAEGRFDVFFFFFLRPPSGATLPQEQPHACGASSRQRG